ncbi:MAG: hypothetical protein JRH11_04490 [Deltaproteobacteria bacterium]|nr:hypothetical protein [Deltaproteobacteria bacterium]
MFTAIVPVIILGGSGGCNGSTEGEIRSTGAPFGDYTLHPTSCYSGQHEDFFGVWVAPEASDDPSGNSGWRGGLKLVKDHSGAWEVYVESPTECQSFDCVTRPLDPAHCERYEVDVHNTNTIVNDIWVREGSASFECETPEGGTFAAHLVFEGCS